MDLGERTKEVYRVVSQNKQVHIPIALLAEKDIIHSRRAFLHPVELNEVKYIALFNEKEIEEYISLFDSVEHRRMARAMTETSSISHNKIYLPFAFVVPGSLVGIREAASGKGILISYETIKNGESTPPDLRLVG